MTVVICLLIAAAVVLAIVSIVRDKKKGKSCSCGCSGCAMNGACHTSHPTDKSAENKTTENESSPDLPESAAEEK